MLRRAPAVSTTVTVQVPLPSSRVTRLERGAHVQGSAHRADLGGRGFPHHSGSAARIAEALDEGLGGGAVLLLAELQRAPHAVHHRAQQAQALDALRRPIGGDVIAAHAPHLLGVGLEEDGEEPLAELVAHPLMERLRRRDRPHAGPAVGGDAGDAFEDAEVAQRLEGLQRIGVELALVIDARQARAIDEIVGQDLVPEVDDLSSRLREEPVAADVETGSLCNRRCG